MCRNFAFSAAHIRSARGSTALLRAVASFRHLLSEFEDYSQASTEPPAKVLNVMSFDSAVGDLIAIVQHCQEIQDIHDTLAALPQRGYSERVAVALKFSKQKLELWKKTWLGDAANPVETSERLWGKGGWVVVQELLAEVATTIQLLKDADAEPNDTKVGRKPIWKRFEFRPKKPEVSSAKSPSVLDLALELEKIVDQLWFQSEVSFESIHGMAPEKHGPQAKDHQFASAVPIRQAALALYQACERSTAQCYLEIDLLRDRAMLPDPRNTPPPASETSLFYHIHLEPPNTKVDLRGIVAESFNSPEPATKKPSSIITYDEPDLELFKSTPPSTSRIVGLQPDHSAETYYFRVATAQPAAVSISETDNLAQELYLNRTAADSGTLPPLSFNAKLDLAYDLVQCGFHLLGTPWLASLSTERLRRIHTGDRSTCVLAVTTVPPDSLHLADPDALSESAQLFRLGMALIEIALDGPEPPHPEAKKKKEPDDDPYLHASRLLPRVHSALGWNYARACAFCVRDRGKRTGYGRPFKYMCPGETGWGVYLRGLLGGYYGEVVLRYVFGLLGGRGEGVMG